MDNWYGKFDINFVGATINCDTPEKIAAVHRLLKNETDTYLVDILDSDNANDFSRGLWYNTTYIHESRHIHDYLLCPILNHEYNLRMMTVLSALQGISHSSDPEKCKYNILPIPLSKWFRLDENAQKDQLLEWSEDGLIASAPMFTVPGSIHMNRLLDSPEFLSADSYTKALFMGFLHYETNSHILRRKNIDQFGRTLSIRSMMEASALSCQLCAAGRLYGESCEELLMKSIGDAARYENMPQRRFSEYSTVFSLVNNYLSYNQTINPSYLIPFVSVLMNWCFCGNVLRDPGIDPLNRLSYFINNDYGKGLTFSDIISDPMGVFAHWDKLYGSTPINFAEYNLRQRASYEEILELSAELGFDVLSDYVQMIAKASQRMALVYMDNPLNYIIPDRYYDSFMSFTNVPVRFIIHARLKDFTDVPLVNNNVVCKDEDCAFTVTYDKPKVKFNLLDKAQEYNHAELDSSISSAFVPYGNLMEAIFGEDPEDVDTESINKLIYPQEVRFVF